ncbi:MAG: hypothetical protein QW327_01245 [Candidatus Odinarchaeota archaeon]
MEELHLEVYSIIQSIAKKFYLKQRLEIKDILLSDAIDRIDGNRKTTGRVYFDGEILHINKFAVKQSLFKEFLIKEVAKTFLPRILFNIERSKDFCYYIAYKLTRNKSEWLKIWEADSPPIYMKDLAYTPQYDLIEIDNITDGRAVKLIFDFFSEAEKYRDKLDLEDYLLFYNSIQKEITPRISERDYKLLLEICKYNTPDLTTLSKNMGLSVKKVKRHYYKLKKHLWLNFLAFPNWSKIGLEYVIVLVDPVNKQILNVKERLVKPYTRIIHRIGGGEASKILFICTPPFGTIYVIEKYLRKLEYDGLIKNYNIMKPVKFTRSINMKLLNIKRGEWELENIEKSNNDYPVIYEMDLGYQPHPPLFDKEDIRILFELDTAPGVENPVNRVSKKTRIPRGHVSKRFKRLREDGFFISYPVVYPPLIKLPETIFTIVKRDKNEPIEELKQVFLKFPDNYIFDLEDGLVAVNHVSWEIAHAFNIITKRILALKGIGELKLFFEHVNYGSMPSPSRFFKEGGWMHPSGFWS